MRLDVLREGQSVGVADPAARKMQGGITVAWCTLDAAGAGAEGGGVGGERTGFLKVSPHQVVHHIGREGFDGHGASSQRGARKENSRWTCRQAAAACAGSRYSGEGEWGGSAGVQSVRRPGVRVWRQLDAARQVRLVRASPRLSGLRRGSPAKRRPPPPTRSVPRLNSPRIHARPPAEPRRRCRPPALAMARINLPPLTRGLLASLLVGTLLNFVLRPVPGWMQKVETPLTSAGHGVPYLAIVPGVSVVYPWVFALATVIEQNVLGLVVTGLTLFYGGRYLERAWGSTEFSKFILFVAVIPNTLSFLLYIFAYLISKNAAAL